MKVALQSLEPGHDMGRHIFIPCVKCSSHSLCLTVFGLFAFFPGPTLFLEFFPAPWRICLPLWTALSGWDPSLPYHDVFLGLLNHSNCTGFASVVLAQLWHYCSDNNDQHGDISFSWKWIDTDSVSDVGRVCMGNLSAAVRWSDQHLIWGTLRPLYLSVH